MRSYTRGPCLCTVWINHSCVLIFSCMFIIQKKNGPNAITNVMTNHNAHNMIVCECVCVCTCVRAGVCACVRACVCVHIYIYLYVYIHLSVCLSVCLFIYLSFYLSCISCNNKQLAVMHKFDLVMTFTYILRSPKQIA